MPQYSVDDVIEIIKGLSGEEKQALQQVLPTLLQMSNEPPATGSPALLGQTMTGVNIHGSHTIELHQTQLDRGSAIAQHDIQTMAQSAALTDITQVLDQLRQLIAVNPILNVVEKQTIEVPLQTLEAELKQPKPDKTLLGQAIATLKKGLEGVESLADPVMKVAELLAKAWAVL